MRRSGLLFAAGLLLEQTLAINPSCTGEYAKIASEVATYPAAQAYCSKKYPVPVKTATVTAAPEVVTATGSAVTSTVTTTTTTTSTTTETDTATTSVTVTAYQTVTVTSFANGAPSKRAASTTTTTTTTTTAPVVVIPSTTTKSEITPAPGKCRPLTSAPWTTASSSIDKWASVLWYKSSIVGEICTCIQEPVTSTVTTTPTTTVTTTPTATSTVTVPAIEVVTATTTTTTSATVTTTATTTATVTSYACGTHADGCRSGTSCQNNRCLAPPDNCANKNTFDSCDAANTGSCVCFGGVAGLRCLPNPSSCGTRCNDDGDCAAGSVCINACGTPSCVVQCTTAGAKKRATFARMQMTPRNGFLPFIDPVTHQPMDRKGRN